ncbi:hypothetical protein [Sanguibacter suaedae]|uniref:FXSXX-COOH protein n=1 Tax=Sanguibacter suaedae TaxID=2795737 RepID=A0A934I972_9MICO|nr:hypothetical protein [Sanguibacter suaedae]MBI9113535.1 hypothetical protein [Sanguibacter suaedae]
MISRKPDLSGAAPATLVSLERTGLAGLSAASLMDIRQQLSATELVLPTSTAAVAQATRSTPAPRA